jgi:hypothetical protein
MESSRALTTLTWLLRGLGALMLTAVVAAVMPTDWMAAVNDWLGLAPLPRTPLTEYLTRSLSAVFAGLGAMMLFLARDARRYQPFILFVSWLTLSLGIFYLVLDVWAGMPASWTWGEGPPTALLGAWMVWLARRVEPRPPA